MFWNSSRDLTISALAVILPVSMFLAPGAGADPNLADQPGPVVDAAPVIEVGPAPEAAPLPEAAPAADTAPAPEAAPASDLAPAPEVEPAPDAAPVEDTALDLPPIVVPAAHIDIAPRLLGPGVGSEQGLQVETIRVERNICAEFPEIHNIIGVRPDSKPWHPSGRAIDIMIPAAGSASGIALGNEIRDYALRNADKFGVMDVIWRGTYYTPAGPHGSGYGHYDHVHITTFGGGYPTGGEEYFSEG